MRRPGHFKSEFRSLFCWITLIGARDEVADLLAAWFRSLFCWITLIGPGVWAYVVADEYKFRSLFCWITLIGVEVERL